MSKKETRNVTCPICSKENEVIVYDSINVTVDPECKDLLFNNKINSFFCHSCNSEITLVKDLMYNDMDKKVMIQFEPQVSREDMLERIDQLNSNLAALNRMKEVTYNYRYTANWDEFLEKVRIFSSGFNDIPMEFVKATIKKDFENEKKIKVHSLRFLEALGNNLTQSNFEITYGNNKIENITKNISFPYHTFDIKISNSFPKEFLIVNEEYFNWILKMSSESEESNSTEITVDCPRCRQKVTPTFHGLCPYCDSDLGIKR